MPGRTSLSFQTEPSFFRTEELGNQSSVVIVARDTMTGEIVGTASCGYRRLMVDGEVRMCGYLGGLRGLPGVRSGTLLARGFRFLRELAGGHKHALYLTAIFDSNKYAVDLLSSGRAGLPTFMPVGRMLTFLLPLHRKRRSSPRSACVVRGVAGGASVETARAINRFNTRHQFAPHYEATDLSGDGGLLGGFDPRDLYVYRDGAGIDATLGVWDLRALKQWVVMSYPWRYRLIAPLAPIGARLGLTPPLPRIGRPVDLLYGSFATYTPGREGSFSELLDAVLSDCSGQGFTLMAVGVPADSTVGPMLRRHAVDEYASTVFQVYWPGEVDGPLASPDLPPNLEIATL